MAYHYLNVIDDYNDNITILKEKLNIHPKVVYNIGYSNNNIINNNIHEYLFNEDILLDKILEQQTIEMPDLININNNINDILIFLIILILKQSKYIIIKIVWFVDCIKEYINQLGFMEFYKDNNNYYFINMYKTNALYGITLFKCV